MQLHPKNSLILLTPLIFLLMLGGYSVGERLQQFILLLHASPTSLLVFSLVDDNVSWIATIGFSFLGALLVALATLSFYSLLVSLIDTLAKNSPIKQSFTYALLRKLSFYNPDVPRLLYIICTPKTSNTPTTLLAHLMGLSFILSMLSFSLQYGDITPTKIYVRYQGSLTTTEYNWRDVHEVYISGKHIDIGKGLGYNTLKYSLYMKDRHILNISIPNTSQRSEVLASVLKVNAVAQNLPIPTTIHIDNNAQDPEGYKVKFNPTDAETILNLLNLPK